MVRIKDNGYAAFLRTVAKTPETVKVGIFGQEAQTTHQNDRGGAITVGELAGIHEMGEGNIPERSWLRSWVDGHEKVIGMFISGRLRAAYRQGQIDTKEAMRQVGLWAVGRISQHINSNIPPPLAPMTIKRKGHDLALVETHQMIDSIKSEVAARNA